MKAVKSRTEVTSPSKLEVKARMNETLWRGLTWEAPRVVLFDYGPKAKKRSNFWKHRWTHIPQESGIYRYVSLDNEGSDTPEKRKTCALEPVLTAQATKRSTSVSKPTHRSTTR